MSHWGLNRDEEATKRLMEMSAHPGDRRKAEAWGDSQWVADEEMEDELQIHFDQFHAEKQRPSTTCGAGLDLIITAGASIHFVVAAQRWRKVGEIPLEETLRRSVFAHTALSTTLALVALLIFVLEYSVLEYHDKESLYDTAWQDNWKLGMIGGLQSAVVALNAWMVAYVRHNRRPCSPFLVSPSLFAYFPTLVFIILQALDPDVLSGSRHEDVKWVRLFFTALFATCTCAWGVYVSRLVRQRQFQEIPFAVVLFFEREHHAHVYLRWRMLIKHFRRIQMRIKAAQKRFPHDLNDPRVIGVQAHPYDLLPTPHGTWCLCSSSFCSKLEVSETVGNLGSIGFPTERLRMQLMLMAAQISLIMGVLQFTNALSGTVDAKMVQDTYFGKGTLPGVELYLGLSGVLACRSRTCEFVLWSNSSCAEVLNQYAPVSAEDCEICDVSCQGAMGTGGLSLIFIFVTLLIGLQRGGRTGDLNLLKIGGVCGGASVSGFTLLAIVNVRAGCYTAMSNTVQENSPVMSFRLGPTYYAVACVGLLGLLITALHFVVPARPARPEDEPGFGKRFKLKVGAEMVTAMNFLERSADFEDDSSGEDEETGSGTEEDDEDEDEDTNPIVSEADDDLGQRCRPMEPLTSVVLCH